MDTKTKDVEKKIAVDFKSKIKLRFPDPVTPQWENGPRNNSGGYLLPEPPVVVREKFKLVNED